MGSVVKYFTHPAMRPGRVPYSLGLNPLSDAPCYSASKTQHRGHSDRVGFEPELRRFRLVAFLVFAVSRC
jgi:hypothetical protein